ncbi:MAG TPA: VOC family protein [Bacillales bacterium]|nr:VOC family protein [Bacillales bacterium]
MNYREFGLILFVERYVASIHFYKNILQLPVRKEKDTLVSFDLPYGYLMVEQGGVGSTSEKRRSENPTVLRFDVDDLAAEVETLKKRGVSFTEDRLTFSWGTIAVFHDPDGNRIELGEINRTSGSYKSI